jgi:hypothetical protein
MSRQENEWLDRFRCLSQDEKDYAMVWLREFSSEAIKAAPQPTKTLAPTPLKLVGSRG